MTRATEPQAPTRKGTASATSTGRTALGTPFRRRQKRSAVWQYFRELDALPNLAECLLCHAQIPRGRNLARNTTNLRKHLLHRHAVRAAASPTYTSPPSQPSHHYLPNPHSSSNAPPAPGSPPPSPPPHVPPSTAHPPPPQQQPQSAHPHPPLPTAAQQRPQQSQQALSAHVHPSTPSSAPPGPASSSSAPSAPSPLHSAVAALARFAAETGLPSAAVTGRSGERFLSALGYANVSASLGSEDTGNSLYAIASAAAAARSDVRAALHNASCVALVVAPIAHGRVLVRADDISPRFVRRRHALAVLSRVRARALLGARSERVRRILAPITEAFGLSGRVNVIIIARASLLPRPGDADTEPDDGDADEDDEESSSVGTSPSYSVADALREVPVLPCLGGALERVAEDSLLATPYVHAHIIAPAQHALRGPDITLPHLTLDDGIALLRMVQERGLALPCASDAYRLGETLRAFNEARALLGNGASIALALPVLKTLSAALHGDEYGVLAGAVHYARTAVDQILHDVQKASVAVAATMVDPRFKIGVAASEGTDMAQYAAEGRIACFEDVMEYWRRNSERWPRLAEAARNNLAAPCVATEEEGRSGSVDEAYCWFQARYEA